MRKRIIFILSFLIGCLIIFNLNSVNAATSGNYEYNDLDNGTVEITGYTGSETNLNIPSTLNGKKVTKIGKDAFYRNNDIVKVTIPNTVTDIGIAAFEQCKSLEEVKLPNSIQNIENYAFSYCFKLTTINLEENLKKIGGSSFDRCEKLSDIKIPSTVETIGIEAFSSTAIESIELPKNLKDLGYAVFSECSNLKEISIAEGNTNYICEDGVIYNKDKTELIYYLPAKTNTSFTMPNTVKKILGEAFRDTKNLKNITLSSNLERIEDWAFRDTGITKIELPKSLSSMAPYVFSGATNLKELVIRGSIEGIPYGMCEGCTSLNKVTFEDCKNLYSFSDWAFDGCTSLVSIKLPETIDLIGKYCFSDCINLTTVDINDSISFIENKWNYNCPKLTNYKIPEGLVKLENGDYRRIATITINNPNNYYNYKKAWEVLDIVNQRRKENGLTELKMDTELLEGAMLRAQETSILFEHTRPDGTDCSTVVTSKASILGENIAAGSTTAEEVMEQWMDSAIHKSNILGSKYKSIGIGCYRVGGVYYWVQIFSSNEAKEATRSDKEINKTVKQNLAYGLYEKIGVTNYISKLTGESKLMFEEDGIVQGILGDTWTAERAWIENLGWTGVVNYFATTDATWTSSNTNVLKVSNDGKLELVGIGTANVTMTVGNVTRTYKIQVNLPFKDVKTTDWFYDSVKYTYTKGIILGTSDTTYNPNTKLTRGMLVTILHRMDGKPAPKTQNQFKDVYKSQYYYDAVIWANEKGIVHGYGDGSKFGPDDNITRQDLAVILRNFAQYKGKNVNVTSDLSKFKDGNLVSDYAKSAVEWAVGKGVITGNNNGESLTPHANSTRAEAAGMIYNYCTKVNV